MVTLTQLEYIVALDDLRHFAAAADKCFVTQPTLSMQVKKLEEDLGVVIFDRRRQPLEPTAMGAKIIEQARLKYPALEIGVEEVESEELVRRLKTERLDAGIFVTPYGDDDIKEYPVFYEEMLVYAHPEHELLGKQVLEVKDLEGADLWLLGEGHCFRNQVLNFCGVKKDRRRALPFHFESNSLETLMRIVDMEGGCTFIPELALQYLPEGKRAQVRAIEHEKPLREVSVICSAYFVRQQLVKLLCQEIRNVVPERMWQSGRGMVVEWKTKNV